MSKTGIITNQYVQIDLTLAGIGERIFSRMLDYFIMFIYSLGIYYITATTDMSVSINFKLIFTVFFYLPIIFYSFLWEILNRGQSPGKMLFGMRVVMCDGTMPTIGTYLLRWMLLLVDVGFSWIGVAIILLNKNNQRIGDLAAGTIVIKERDYHRIQVSLDEFEHLSRDYVPVFSQAENLSLEQVNTINEALTRNDKSRSQCITNLSAKVKGFLKVSSTTDDETFLKTLTRDYQYYALEEI
jgi:Predicted membrane protein/domain